MALADRTPFGDTDGCGLLNNHVRKTVGWVVYAGRLRESRYVEVVIDVSNYADSCLLGCWRFTGL